MSFLHRHAKMDNSTDHSRLSLKHKLSLYISIKPVVDLRWLNSSCIFISFSCFFSFATGGEDGYVRLHTFDPDYDEMEQKFFSVAA